MYVLVFNFFKFLITFYLFCMHVPMWVHMCHGIYVEAQGLLMSQFSPSTTWALRIQLRGASSAFYRLRHLMGPLFSIYNTSLCVSPLCLFSIEALKHIKVAGHCNTTLNLALLMGSRLHSDHMTPIKTVSTLCIHVMVV